MKNTWLDIIRRSEVKIEESWMISIPVKGYNPKGEEDVECNKVAFHEYLDPAGRKMFLGSTVLEGKRDSIKDKALELIDNALSKLCFASASMLNLDDSEYYLTPVKEVNRSGIPKIGKDYGTIHRVSSSFTMRYKIGEDRTKAILSNISQLNSRKNEALNKALGIYRVATESNNELQAIDTYFSCIQTIVREDIGKSKLESSDLRNALKGIASDEKDFEKNFDKYWGKYRSGGSHGLLDLMNRSLVREAKKDLLHVNQWARKIILDYINRNKRVG
jgi:hypothetical protein